MCLAIPGKIVSKKGKHVVVDYDGERHSATLVENDYKVGDWVIVQAHIVIEKVPRGQVKEWRKFVRKVDGR